MTIIETPIFTKKIVEYVSDEDYRSLQLTLIERPSAGSVIQGTGGLRKYRWAHEGKGKSGGLRIIYFWDPKHEAIYMLLPFRKSEKKDLTSEQKKILKNVIKEYLT